MPDQGHLDSTYNCGSLLRLTIQKHPLVLLSSHTTLTLPTHDITLKLVAIQGHVQMKPSLVLCNLVVVVSWHAIRELYHVSQQSSGP